MSNVFKTLMIIFVFVNFAYGEIIISEVLSNEPNNRVLLEWFELYNNSSFTVDLSDYIILESDDTLDITSGMIIPPDSYAVLCRRLEPREGGDCFEYFWGDSSGIWGDAPGEDYSVYEVGMTLSNSAGSIYIYRPDESGVDHIIWTKASGDGRSVERDDVLNPFSGWHECYDLFGSTPGRQNSTEPLVDERYFIQIEPQVVSISRDDRSMSITYGTPTGTRISVYIYDDSALRLRILIEESTEPVNQLIWNLEDQDGNLLNPGLYFILFRTTGEIDVNKSIPIVISP